MAKLHHATAKRAEDNGVTMSRDTEDTLWIATKGKALQTHEDPKTALSAALFDALLRAEYPALSLTRLEQGWSIRHVEHEEPVWNEPHVPTTADLDDVRETCDDLGLDIEAGIEDDDEPEKGGSVVDAIYKVIYAERGDATNCGDWLAQELKQTGIETVIGKKTVRDMQAMNSLFAENGVISEDGPWGNAFHDPNQRRNGWEGRFAMSGRNILRKRVADAGFLMVFGTKIEAPADFCDQHRTKVKAKKVKEEVKEEATTALE